MSQYRRKNLLKTLTTSDIDEVLNQYGSEHPIVSHESGTKSGLEKMNANMSGLQAEWDHLFCRKSYLQQLRHRCCQGNIGTENFRSVCWRIFWECLSEDKDKWVEDVTEQRKQYTEIRNKYVIDPYEKEDIDVRIHHPLSQSEDSIWHQYFQDNELRDTIMQDLNRLFPEIEFFQQEFIKSIILHILFCYARENQHVQYKQGMHEILAPLVYIMLSNSLVVKEASDQVGEDMKVVMDSKYIEHDAYMLFSNVMEHIQTWYANLVPLQGDQTTAISKKLTRIQSYMLKRYDNTLREHLEKIQVAPQLYGIRWVRLLFGREFALNRLLVLWDAIFACGVDLVDYIFLAMLINLRSILLQSDFNICLGHLMKYPADTDTRYILKRAMTLKNHKFTETETIPSSVANQVTDNNVCSYNSNGKAVFYAQRTTSTGPVGGGAPHAGGAGGGVKGTYSEPCADLRSEYSGVDVGGMRVQRTNSLGKQISNIKDKVGSSTPQIISRLSDTLKTKNHHNPTMDTLIEDHARLQKQVTELRTQLDKMSTISLFCGGKMDLYISLLQECLLKHETCGELEVHSFAGLKQVRDILKDGLENCGTVPDYEEDFRDIDEHIADASHNEQLASKSDADDDKVKITTISDTLSLVQADSCATGTSHECEPTLSSESCDCDENSSAVMVPSTDEPVEVMYFDHSPPSPPPLDKPPPNVDVIYEQSTHAHKVKKKDVVTVGGVGLSDGAGYSDPSFSSHMYDEVKNELEGGFDDVTCEGELNGVVSDGGEESPSPPPILVDPLTSFQIDLHDDTF